MFGKHGSKLEKWCCFGVVACGGFHIFKGSLREKLDRKHSLYSHPCFAFINSMRRSWVVLHGFDISSSYISWMVLSLKNSWTLWIIMKCLKLANSYNPWTPKTPKTSGGNSRENGGNSRGSGGSSRQPFFCVFRWHVWYPPEIPCL